MHSLARLLGLAGIWAIVVLSPGPDFVATVHHATSRSRRAGMAVVAGIAAGTAIWAISALAGLGLLLAHARWTLNGIRIGGALVLAWLGVRAFRHAGRAEPGGKQVRVRNAPWLTGLLTDLANPKAAIFWTTLFSALLPRHPPLWLDAATVGLVVGIAFAWYSLVALTFSHARVSSRYQRVRHKIDRVTGGVYLILSGRLLLER
jgi:threonine efflux protein